MPHAEIIVAAEQKKRVNWFPPKASRGRAARISGQALFCLRCLARRAYRSPGSRARVRRLRRRKDGIEAIDENGRLDFVFRRERKTFFSGVRSFGAAAPSQGRHQKKRCSYKRAKGILNGP